MLIRNPVYIISKSVSHIVTTLNRAVGMITFALFSIGSALAPNIQTQATCRGFMGLFGMSNIKC